MRYLFILLAFSLISCITQQKCLERYPVKQLDSVTTTVLEKEIHIHDTITFEPRELVIHDTVHDLDTLFVYHKQSKSNGLTQTIDIKKGVITSDCKADSLQRIVDSLIIQKETLIKDKSSFVQENTTNVLTGWQNFLIGCGYVFLVAVLLFIIGIVLKIIK